MPDRVPAILILILAILSVWGYRANSVSDSSSV
jgi:hypothetical protein